MMMLQDDYYMRQALVEAQQAAAEREIPVGAVIVCGDKIIARTHNQTERLNDPTAHAEMLAITAAAGALGAKYLTDCRLYCDVRRCYRMGTTPRRGIWCRRRETRFHKICTECTTPQNAAARRSDGSRMCRGDKSVF